MSLNTKPIRDALVSHAASVGHFERVNGHEPKNAPGNGLTAAVWKQKTTALALASGLAATSALLVFRVRLYANMLQEPQDAIDPNLSDAEDALLNAYNGDFTLDGLVRNVDILGQYGTPLASNAGYLDQDRKMFRVYDIDVPLVINDVWTQSA